MKMIWGTIIAWYLFLAGLAAGAFTTAAIVAFKNKSLKRIQTIGRLITLVALAIGLFLLMFDAEAGFKNPLRFFYLLTNFNSVMTWGVVILGAFGIVCAITLVLPLLKKDVPAWLNAFGVIFAACTAAYTGVLLGVIKTYPLWNTALLPVLFLVSAFSAGMAATLVFSAIFAHGETEKLPSLKKVHFALPIIEVVLLSALFYITASTAPAAQASVSRLISGDLSLLFWIGLVTIGLFVPLLLELLGTFVLNRKRANARPSLSRGPTMTLEFISGASTLVGGFLLRYLILIAAVPIPFVF
jgi:formate-dependent nitrite reductase membrane component NrfD